jgi:general secretion pathway protein A
MYSQYFGLRKSPFAMTPDPACLMLTEQHREALAGLTYAILGRKGFIALIGEAGSGKTTLLARVLERLPVDQVYSSVILTPTLTSAEFLELMLLDFGLSDIPTSKAQRLMMLQRFLVDAQRRGRIVLLVVDEAHKLTPDVLEEIRLLGNFERPDQKLLQIVLAGQNELDDILERGDLRQLKQRISMRLCIGPLRAAEVQQYVGFRWMNAGGAQSAPFSPEAIAQLVRCSHGIPRLINSLCDNALMLAFGEGSISITADHVSSAARDLAITNGNGHSRADWKTVVPLIPHPEERPAEPAAIMDRIMVQTLERYGPREHKSSRFAKCVGIFGFRQKIGEA